MNKLANSEKYSIEKPDGYINMMIAENSLMLKEVKQKIENICKTNELPENVWKYTDMNGSPGFRKAIADFMSKYSFHRAVNPEHIAV